MGNKIFNVAYANKTENIQPAIESGDPNLGPGTLIMDEEAGELSFVGDGRVWHRPTTPVSTASGPQETEPKIYRVLDKIAAPNIPVNIELMAKNPRPNLMPLNYNLFEQFKKDFARDYGDESVLDIFLEDNGSIRLKGAVYGKAQSLEEAKFYPFAEFILPAGEHYTCLPLDVNEQPRVNPIKLGYKFGEENVITNYGVHFLDKDTKVQVGLQVMQSTEDWEISSINFPFSPMICIDSGGIITKRIPNRPLIAYGKNLLDLDRSFSIMGTSKKIDKNSLRVNFNNNIAYFGASISYLNELIEIGNPITLSFEVEGNPDYDWHSQIVVFYTDGSQDGGSNGQGGELNTPYYTFTPAINGKKVSYIHIRPFRTSKDIKVIDNSTIIKNIQLTVGTDIPKTFVKPQPEIRMPITEKKLTIPSFNSDSDLGYLCLINASNGLFKIKYQGEIIEVINKTIEKNGYNLLSHNFAPSFKKSISETGPVSVVHLKDVAPNGKLILVPSAYDEVLQEFPTSFLLGNNNLFYLNGGNGSQSFIAENSINTIDLDKLAVGGTMYNQIGFGNTSNLIKNLNFLYTRENNNDPYILTFYRVPSIGFVNQDTPMPIANDSEFNPQNNLGLLHQAGIDMVITMSGGTATKIAADKDAGYVKYEINGTISYINFRYWYGGSNAQDLTLSSRFDEQNYLFLGLTVNSDKIPTTENCLPYNIKEYAFAWGEYPIPEKEAIILFNSVHWYSDRSYYTKDINPLLNKLDKLYG